MGLRRKSFDFAPEQLPIIFCLIVRDYLELIESSKKLAVTWLNVRQPAAVISYNHMEERAPTITKYVEVKKDSGQVGRSERNSG